MQHLNHNIRQTSLTAYSIIQLDLTLGKQEQQVYDTLKQFPRGLTRNELSTHAGIRINAVCGRVNKLIKKGILREQGKKFDNHSNKENYIVIIA